MRVASMQKPPAWFTVLAIGATIWGLAGGYACWTQLTMTAAQLAALPTAQRDAFSAMPTVIKGAYVLATAGGLAGGALLLLRRRGARTAFTLSLAGVVIQFGWTFLLYRGANALGPDAAIFPAIIAAIAVGEIWLSRFAMRRGWLR